MRKVFELWGDKGVAAVKKQITQLNDQWIMSLFDPHTLTRDEKNKAFTHLMFLKQKRSSDI